MEAAYGDGGAFGVEAPAHDLGGAKAEELGDECREPAVDLLPAGRVQFRLAADLDGPGLAGCGGVVDQHGDLWVALRVPPFLAGGEIDAADVDGVLLLVEHKGQLATRLECAALAAVLAVVGLLTALTPPATPIKIGAAVRQHPVSR